MLKHEVENRTIFHCLTGSRLYGTNSLESDYDYRGVFIPTKTYLLGTKVIEQFEDFGGEDKVLYAIKKAIHLMAENNPNMIELLYIDDSFCQIVKPEWSILRENRNLFLSSKTKYTYSGYAVSQLKRIKTHKKYLLNPVLVKPERKDYNLPDTVKELTNDEINLLHMVNSKLFKNEYKEMALNEQRYRSTLREWQQYEEWKENRNEDRAKLEAKFGYDCKHACQLVRLLRQGVEILTEGTINVNRRGIDADELIAIKNGAWSFDKIMEYCEEMEIKMEELYKTTKLRKEPDRNKISDICAEICFNFLSKEKI